MQQLIPFIPLIIVIWIMLLGIRLNAYMEKKYRKSNPVSIPEKRCPAHKWAWEEQPEMPGTYFIRCQWCKRLPGYDRFE